MDFGRSKKDTDCPTKRFSRTATRGGCPPESANVRSQTDATGMDATGMEWHSPPSMLQCGWPRFGPQVRADHGRGAADYSRFANNPG